MREDPQLENNSQGGGGTARVLFGMIGQPEGCIMRFLPCCCMWGIKVKSSSMILNTVGSFFGYSLPCIVETGPVSAVNKLAVSDY